MICIRLVFLLPIISSLFVLNVAWSNTKAFETALTGQITQHIDPQQLVWLEAESGKFLSLWLTDQTGNAKGAMLLIHDIGQHADSPQLIRPLRESLPQYGWHTLAVQMPILPPAQTTQKYAALYAEFSARLKAAIAHLQSKQAPLTIIIATGQNASFCAAYLANNAAGIDGFIAISLADLSSDVEFRSLNTLPKIKLPVLEVYAEHDRPVVLQNLSRRAIRMRNPAPASDSKEQQSAPKQPNPTNTATSQYQQIRIIGTNEFYAGSHASLLKRIRGWLYRTYFKQSLLSLEY